MSWINFAIFGYSFYLLLLVEMGVAGIKVTSTFLQRVCMLADLEGGAQMTIRGMAGVGPNVTRGYLL